MTREFQNRAVLAAMACLTIAMAEPAHARAAMPVHSEDGRYSMRQTGDGLLRLDTRTGAISHCRQGNDGWACTTVSDDFMALRGKLAKLEKENAALRARIAKLKKSSSAMPGDGRKGPDLPDDEEVDRIMGFFEKLMRRFHGMVRRFRDDVPLREL